MSLPVRHRCAKPACSGVGTMEKGSVEMTMGVPVAFTASANALKRGSPSAYSPQLSYLTYSFCGNGGWWGRGGESRASTHRLSCTHPVAGHATHHAPAGKGVRIKAFVV